MGKVWGIACFLVTCLGADSCISSNTGAHHKYQIYDPRDTSLSNWQQWNLICLGTGGKLVSLQSRRELDCLIKYINDEIDSNTMQKYAIGLHAKSDNGVFEWEFVDSTLADWDAPTPSFSNW